LSLRLRIFLAFALLAILPTLPVTWAVRDLLDRSFSVGLSEEFASGLEAGAESARGWLRAERRSFRGDCEGLVPRGEELLGSLSRGVHPPLPEGFDAAWLAGDSLVAVGGAWLPVAGLRDRARELAPPGGPPVAAPYWIDRANRARLTALLPLGDRVEGWLFLSRPLPPELAIAFDRIGEARQLQAGLILERDNLRRGFLLPFLLVYLLVLAVSLAAAGLLSRRLTQRLELLAEGARRIGAGDWSARVPLRGRDEIARLGSAFNDMAAGLGDQQRRLADLERMAAWREMARSLAHEIKNPLTPISLMVQEMGDRYPGGDAAHEAFLAESGRIIEEEIESLRRLSREFSEFARTPEMQRSRSDLGALLEDLARLYGSVPVKLSLAPELPRFDFDPEQLRRVFSNLFENSLGAMTELPEAERGIELSVTLADERVRVDFRDHGPGVPGEIAKRIFEPHFSTKGGGMGLGLALVRSVCTLHGGDARLESGGSGAHFVIELPLAMAEESP
jgi:nitrogen fixation/metabolism regulation signal transduction histidine kinase